MSDKNNKTSEIEQTPKPRELLLGAIERKDRNALHALIALYFGVNIPKHKNCNDHCAPFDFVFDYLTGEIDFAVVLGNRSGGKTHSFGILDTVVSYLYDNTEIATVGAIQFQAQKCYEYFRDYSQKYPFAHNLTSSASMGRTILKNKSQVQVLTGTMSGVNAPHPQLLFVDEIDLMPWNVLQQALSMPQSKNGVMSKTVLTSTRKFAAGAMQRLLDDAPKKGYKVYQWCVWEVIEKLPADPAKLNEIRHEFAGELPDGIHKADGYYTWRDALQKKRSPMEAETWAVEWRCRKPGTQGTVYGSNYSDENNNIGDWSPVGKPGHIFLFEDFGASDDHPDVVLFVWIPITFDRMVIFDELYMRRYGTEQIWGAVRDKLLEYGYEMPDLLAGKHGSIEGWIPDYHGLTEIMDRQRRGAPMTAQLDKSELYIVENGIKMVGGFLQSGRIMITAKCSDLRAELMGDYRYAKNADGTYSRTPLKKNDHGCDALRIGTIQVHQRLTMAIMRQAEIKYQDKHPESVPAQPVEIVAKEPLPSPYERKNQDIDDMPITAGMLNKRW